MFVSESVNIGSIKIAFYSLWSVNHLKKGQNAFSKLLLGQLAYKLINFLI